jgi:hypothetical protein
LKAGQAKEFGASSTGSVCFSMDRIRGFAGIRRAILFGGPWNRQLAHPSVSETFYLKVLHNGLTYFVRSWLNRWERLNEQILWAAEPVTPSTWVTPLVFEPSELASATRPAESFA